MNEATEYAENLRNAERFFLKNPKGAFLFAVSNDEVVQRNVNSTLQQLLRGKGKNIHIHSWDKRPEAPHPLEQLRQVQQAHPQLHGLILNGLDLALDSHSYLVIQLNFAREALLEFGIPLFFWLSSRTLQRVNREAIDLYNQRASANLYFEHDPHVQDGDVSAHRYVAQETTHANASLAHLEARMKLLQQQLDEAEAQQLEPTVIANEIVLELLDVYRQILGAEPLLHALLDKYGALIDQENPENCFDLARVFYSIGNLGEATMLWSKALTLYRQLATKNSDAYLPNVAKTLNNLALLQKAKNDYAAAEVGYNEALAAYRFLAAKNPDAYLPNVAGTLNNLALLQKVKNDYAAAEAGYNEALAAYRQLAAKNPDAYLPDVAMILHNLAVLHYAKNDYAAAEAGINEAFAIYRLLATKNPDAYLPYVATTLNNLANLQSDKSDYAAAEAGYNEALAAYRQLAAQNPDAYLPDFAGTLNNLAGLHYDKNDYAAAEAGSNEALAAYRSLAAQNPDAYLPSVAHTLINMSLLYQELANKEQSLAMIREALQILLPMVEKVPYTQKYVDKALEVINDWGIDPDEFIKQLRNPA